MDQRDEAIVVETARHRIAGTLRLPRDGYQRRLTDYLNAPERSFLPLTNVEITSLDNRREVERRPFIVLSASQIVMAIPADAGPGEN